MSTSEPDRSDAWKQLRPEGKLIVRDGNAANTRKHRLTRFTGTAVYRDLQFQQDDRTTLFHLKRK